MKNCIWQWTPRHYSKRIVAWQSYDLNDETVSNPRAYAYVLCFSRDRNDTYIADLVKALPSDTEKSILAKVRARHERMHS